MCFEDKVHKAYAHPSNLPRVLVLLAEYEVYPFYVADDRGGTGHAVVYTNKLERRVRDRIYTRPEHVVVVNRNDESLP